jgi:MoxR-like ATPase
MPDLQRLRELINDDDFGLQPELIQHLPPPLQARREKPDALPNEREAARRVAAALRARGQPIPFDVADKLKNRYGYEIGPDLLRAFRVSLLLRQPLFITGEPGVGKTLFAHAIADLLDLPLAKTLVKTTTTGRDLLYNFDDLRRFRDAALGGTLGARAAVKPLKDYVTFNGLGLAILRAAGPSKEIEPKLNLLEVAGEEYRAHSKVTLGELFPHAFDLGNGTQLKKSVLSVVLIDELDKAARDAPNDLLDEIENMRFEVSELGVEIVASLEQWPIVIVTSNSERTLPDPFLRRCVFHHLQLPEDKLPEIVARQLPPLTPGDKLVNGTIRIFRSVREIDGLEKKPSTAELVGAVAFLYTMGFDPSADPTEDPRYEAIRSQLAGVLLKKNEDVAKAVEGMP